MSEVQLEIDLSETDILKIADESNIKKFALFCQKWFLIEESEKLVVGRIDKDQFGNDCVKKLSTGAFKLKENSSIKIWADKNKEETKLVSLADFWINSRSRKVYDGECFNPNLKAAHPNYLNLYFGLRIKPVAFELAKNAQVIEGLNAPDGSKFLVPGEVLPWVQLWFKNLCDSNNETFWHSVRTFASQFQKPWVKANLALDILGPQGVGKTLALLILGALWHPSHVGYLAESKRGQSQFNGHLSGKMLMIHDEASWGGNKSDAGFIKALTTQKTIDIERKGKDSRLERNYVIPIYLTNEDFPVAIDHDDRRHLVLKAVEFYKKNSEFFADFYEYYGDDEEKTEEQIRNLGYLLHWFLTMDLKDFKPWKNVPDSQAKTDLKVRSAGSESQFFIDMLKGDVLDDMGSISTQWQTKDVEIQCSLMFEAYQNYSKEMGIKFFLDRSRFGKKIAEIFSAERIRSNKGDRPYIYIFKSIPECKKMLAAHFNTSVEFLFKDEDKEQSTAKKEAPKADVEDNENHKIELPVIKNNDVKKEDIDCSFFI